MPSPSLLEPDWAQDRPSTDNIVAFLQHVELDQVDLDHEPFPAFLSRLRESHANGGAYLVAFDIAPDPAWNWFASRNRLTEDNLLDSLLSGPALRAALPDLKIPERKANTGLDLVSSFELDGRLASRLHYGGAYWHREGDGRAAKQLALQVCEAMFDQRFAEIAVYESTSAWTPWFYDVAWDLTAVIFDRRLQRLWIFVLTDTD